MEYAEAVRLVTDDVRKSFPDIGEAEAVDYVRHTIYVGDGPTPVGGFPLIDYGDRLTDAYRIVLS